jgi:hypothetical protein
MMAVEVIMSLALAGGVLWLVLSPLFRPGSIAPDVYEPPDPTETRKGVAVAALKEIEFDRETGKLSDGDYAELYARYSAEAIEAMRAEDGSAVPAAAASSASGGTDDAIEAMVAADVLTLEAAAGSAMDAPACSTCGPRPESDAVFCSQCGKLLPHPALCVQCGVPLEPAGKFCGGCGVAVSGAVAGV